MNYWIENTDLKKFCLWLVRILIFYPPSAQYKIPFRCNDGLENFFPNSSFIELYNLYDVDSQNLSVTKFGLTQCERWNFEENLMKKVFPFK